MTGVPGTAAGCSHVPSAAPGWTAVLMFCLVLLLGRTVRAHALFQKHLLSKQAAALAQSHKSAEVEAHKASVACHHDPVGLSINIDQSGRGVGLKRGNGLLLLRRECSDRFDLIH